MENWRCAEHGQSLHSDSWTHLGVAADPDSSSQTNPWPRQTSFEQCTNAFSCARTHKQNVPSNAKVLVSVASTTFCECTATRSCRRNELPKSSMKLAKATSRIHRGQHGTSHTLRGPIQSGIGYKRARDIAGHTREHSWKPDRASRR